MPARLQVSLSESEVKKLLELNNNPNVPARTRKRAEAHGVTTPLICPSCRRCSQIAVKKDGGEFVNSPIKRKCFLNFTSSIWNNNYKGQNI